MFTHHSCINLLICEWKGSNVLAWENSSFDRVFPVSPLATPTPGHVVVRRQTTAKNRHLAETANGIMIDSIVCDCLQLWNIITKMVLHMRAFVWFMVYFSVATSCRNQRLVLMAYCAELKDAVVAVLCTGSSFICACEENKAALCLKTMIQQNSLCVLLSLFPN